MEEKKSKITITKEDVAKICKMTIVGTIFGTICYKCGAKDGQKAFTRGLAKMFTVNPKLEGDMWESLIKVRRAGL